MNTMTFDHSPLRDFEQAKRKAFWRDLFSRLSRKCNDLLAFDQIRQSLPLKGQHDRGLQAVSLDNIVGSEGRYHDFDRAFFPRQSRIRDRWVSIDRAYYEQVTLPPVELAKVGEMYFVRDGNHRVSVARARGQGFIDAYVTELEVSVPGELSEKC
jgi:hypothetical protein